MKKLFVAKELEKNGMIVVHYKCTIYLIYKRAKPTPE